MTYFLDFDLTAEESTKRWTVVGLSARQVEKTGFYTSVIRRRSEPDQWVFRFPSHERQAAQILAALNDESLEIAA